MTTWRSSPATMPGLSARAQKLAAPKKASQQVPSITPSGHRIARALRSTPTAGPLPHDVAQPLMIELPIARIASYVLTGNRVFEGYLVLDAEILPDLAPHLAHVATFAIHKSPDYFIEEEWRISCVEVGASIGLTDSFRRNDCIAKAKHFLQTVTPARMMRAIEKAMAETGEA